MTEPAPQLEYGRSTPYYRSTRWWTKVFSASMLLAVAVLLVPRYASHARLLYWQRECLTYHAPRDRVVFDNHPVESRRLLSPPSDYDGSVERGAFLYPPEWRSFHTGMSGGLMASSGTAFLGERATPAGTRVLVAVDLFFTTPGPHAVTASLGVSVVVSGTSYRSPQPMATAAVEGDGRYIPLYAADRFRVFAGQPDAADDSHFTIDYELNGKRHTLDGWLANNGTVKIESRD